jgi:alpha-L-rhamnosidase
MLRNPDYPGLAWSIVNYDATAIWERFNLDKELREDRSHDHHAMNHPSAWLLTHLAGIQANHRQIVLKPHIPRDLDWARASVGTPQGTVESGWKKKNGTVEWNIVVPPNCTAKAVFPDHSGKAEQTLSAGEHRFEWKLD